MIRLNLTTRDHTVAVSAEFNYNEGTLSPIGFWFPPAVHSLPLTINMISNTLIKSFTGDDDYSIELSVHEFEVDKKTQEIHPNDAVYLILQLFLLCTYCLWTLNVFVKLPVIERTTQIKKLQRMCGISASTYWASMFVFDFFIFIISLSLIFVELQVLFKMRSGHWFPLEYTREKPLSIMLLNISNPSHDNFKRVFFFRGNFFHCFTVRYK